MKSYWQNGCQIGHGQSQQTQTNGEGPIRLSYSSPGCYIYILFQLSLLLSVSGQNNISQSNKFCTKISQMGKHTKGMQNLTLMIPKRISFEKIVTAALLWSHDLDFLYSMTVSQTVSQSLTPHHHRKGGRKGRRR